jgi:hypothetical protein
MTREIPFEEKDCHILLSCDTCNWLKTDEGLAFLTSAWRTAIRMLQKAGGFQGTNGDEEYRILKTRVYCISIEIRAINKWWNHAPHMRDEPELFDEVQHKKDMLSMQDELHNLSEEEKDKWWDERKEDVRVFTFQGTFFIGYDFSSDANEILGNLSMDKQKFILEVMWDYIEQNEVIRQEKSICDNGNVFCWQKEEDEDLEKIYTTSIPAPHMPVIRWADIDLRFQYVTTNLVFQRLTGKTFREISTSCFKNSRILPSTLSGEQIIGTRLFEGTGTTRVEQDLAMLLVEHGFLVSLEPDLYIPQQINNTRRTPDLLVIHRGRILVIEIDSRYHLIREDTRSVGMRRNEANVEKWIRDRDLDRFMICNGIPVLRVWYTDVEKKPGEILSQVLQIFDSFGESRFGRS